MDQILTGKVAVITGAASGIGRAIAGELAAQGAAVVLTDVDKDLGEGAALEVGGTYLQADVSTRQDIDGVVGRTVELHGGLDILVNSAGITRFLDFFSVTEEEWDRINSVNARGTFSCLQSAAAVMKESGGAIINIASIAGKGYRHTSSVAYAASKGAVIGLTRAAAVQLAPYRIRVNAICPGMTVTPLLAAWRDTVEGGEKWAQMLSEVPLGIANDPQQIAALSAFLGSDNAATVTGQAWNVDGGLIMD